MAQSDPRFLELLSMFEVRAFEEHASAVYGLWPDLTLAWMNRAWHGFAAANGGEPAISRDWPLGRSVEEALPAPLRGFYVQAYRECLDGAQVWNHVYECSGPEVFRKFHMTVLPLGAGEGLLVVNSCLVERPHLLEQRTPHEPCADRYRDAQGLLHQCCHCRRVRRNDPPDVWDWVPPWVARSPERTSHVLCDVCLEYYYPESGSPSFQTRRSLQCEAILASV